MHRYICVRTWHSMLMKYDCICDILCLDAQGRKNNIKVKFRFKTFIFLAK